MIDAATALIRALHQFDPQAILEDMRYRSWQSATFSGSRIVVNYRFEGRGAEPILRRGAMREGVEHITISGQIIADVCFDGPRSQTVEHGDNTTCWLNIEFLLVEDN